MVGMFSLPVVSRHQILLVPPEQAPPVSTLYWHSRPVSFPRPLLSLCDLDKLLLRVLYLNSMEFLSSDSLPTFPRHRDGSHAAASFHEPLDLPQCSHFAFLVFQYLLGQFLCTFSYQKWVVIKNKSS